MTTLAAAAGAVDTALFMARRPGLFRTRPGRALTNLALLGAWTTLAVRSACGQGRGDAATRGLAASLCAANTAMLAVHLAHRIAKPRVFAGPAFSGFALAGLLRER